MDYVTIDEVTLRGLVSFPSVEAMNEAIKRYKAEYELGSTDCVILDAISRYACKYTGVCFLSKERIAKEAGFTSRRTAIRACNRLTALGIIKQYETRRVRGDKRQSTNVIVIQDMAANHCARSEERELCHAESQRKVTPKGHTKEASSKTSLQANTYKETDIDTDALMKRGLKTAIPEPIYQAFSPFFNAEELYEMYGVLLRAKAKINPNFMIEDYAEEYLDHFYNVIRLYKSGKVKHLQSYLYVTWERVTAKLARGKRRHELFDLFAGV